MAALDEIERNAAQAHLKRLEGLVEDVRKALAGSRNASEKVARLKGREGANQAFSVPRSVIDSDEICKGSLGLVCYTRRSDGPHQRRSVLRQRR